ncbi:hypothetical protein THRCLA_10946 [Thraustotheca clavata]|uniref:RGS domain-containing protein n=1 Tax=Thraustotheca clavata TaxID=74557 RepID=A0A1V9YCJ4_9STRA|nr:hypothetical protein THRCLA_10946 [Thraustotheca clavata]
MGTLISIVFLLYLLCIIFYSSSWIQDNDIRHVALSFFGHAVIISQIIVPLWATRNERSFTDASIVHTTKINMLEAFLETADGYHAFSEFARIQFSYENAVAWKACSDFKRHGGNSIALYDTYIKAQSVMETNIPGTLRKYYYDIFEKSRKGHRILGYESALDKDLAIFDRFREAILKLMVLDTLPRFQVHPLGKGWQTFVETQESHFVLNHLIGAIDRPENLVVPFDGNVQKVVDRVRRASANTRTDSKVKRELLATKT